MRIKEIWFSQMSVTRQNEVLDAYGATTPEELGFDKAPVFIMNYDLD